MTLKKKFALAAIVVVVGTLAALTLLSPNAAPEEPMPNPNGYDDFVKALEVVSENSDWETASVERLRDLVATNEPVLQLVRTGLTKECRMAPYDLVTNNHTARLVNSRRAAMAFCAADRLALVEARTNDAAQLALDCIRFGSESARGGVVVDGSLGVAIRNLGLARLKEALPGLDSKTALEITAALDDIATRQESCTDIFERENQWVRRGNLRHFGIVPRLIRPFLMRDLRKRAEQNFTKGMNTLQHTELRAAARAYELDHAKPPATARDLVPHYLKALPLDATTGKEMTLE